MRIFTIIIVSILITLTVCDYGAQQQQVQFVPINDWNCSGETKKMCAVDPASEMLQTSSLTECSMQCWIKSSQCLQFNYYQSSSSSSSSSSNCALYYFQPKNYAVATDCQHYVVCIRLGLQGEANGRGGSRNLQLSKLQKLGFNFLKKCLVFLVFLFFKVILGFWGVFSTKTDVAEHESVTQKHLKSASHRTHTVMHTVRSFPFHTRKNEGNKA